MPAITFPSVFSGRGQTRTIDRGRLRQVLARGGAIAHLPASLPGTRLRAVHYYGEVALFAASAPAGAGNRGQLKAMVPSLDRVLAHVAAAIHAVPLAATRVYPEPLSAALARM